MCHDLVQLDLPGLLPVMEYTYYYIITSNNKPLVYDFLATKTGLFNSILFYHIVHCMI